LNSSASKLVRGFNIALRGATLLSKFLLVIFLAKLLEPRELGLFGLITATVGYAIYLLGFEFYSFALREMLARPQSQWISMIRDQVVFYASTYALGLPLLTLLFFHSLLPWDLVWLVFVLIFLEHTAQELNRLLVAAGLPNYAGFVLFVRSGAWCWVVLGLMWIYPDSRQIEVVLIGWILGAFVACAMGLNWLRKLKTNSRFSSIDWHWVSRGLRVAAPLLLASVAIRGIFTLDRYWVEHISGLDALGPYVLFVGMEEAAVMMVGLEVDRVRQGLAILATQPRGEDRTHPHGIRQVADYSMPNVSDKVLRIIHSYTDYVNRVVWKKY
jgi:O-antigen/teichoic acid export membrane protein